MTRKKIFAAVAAAVIIIVAAVLILGQGRTLFLVGDEDIVININEVFEDPGTNIRSAEVQGSVDTSSAGDYALKYVYKDQTVTRRVHVVDPDSLVLGLKGSAETMVKQGEPYIESGAYAIDRNTGVVTDCKTEGDVDTSTPGNYKITYTFTKGYLTRTISRNVRVVKADEFRADEDGIPVLMYHYVYTETDKPEVLNGNYILDSNLEAQLEYLKNNNYYFPSFKELRAYADGKISLPEKSVILTFDDGQAGFLTYGVPLLNKYEIPATSFLIGVKDGENKIRKYANPFVGFESHSYDMHHGGGNIGHGGVISALSKDEIKNDLEKEIMLVGSRDAFAYPYGDITEEGKEAVSECGIECAFSTCYGKVMVGDDFRAFDRVRVQGGSSLEAFVSIL